jgi:CTP synthase (UTP-ammonia lyase)
VGVDVTWLATEPLQRDFGAVQGTDGLWWAPGSPYRSLQGALAALRHGRERGVPTLGTTLDVTERYYCNFALNRDYQQLLHDAGFRVTGVDNGGEARVLEVPGDPFYVATLFVPQARSTREAPHRRSQA